MDSRGSILWIVLLLALLFLGPAVILNLPRSDSGDRASLRTIVEQEHLVDAPAPLPKIPAPKTR